MEEYRRSGCRSGGGIISRRVELIRDEVHLIFGCVNCQKMFGCVVFIWYYHEQVDSSCHHAVFLQDVGEST